MMQSALSGEEGHDTPFYELTMGDTPEQQAKEAARKSDFRPIGIALGYHATKDDATPTAMTCGSPVEMKTIVFGCVPPPAVIFILAARYNAALIDQPSFPKEKQCLMQPEDWREQFAQASAAEEREFEKSAAENIQRSQEKEKKTRFYNR